MPDKKFYVYVYECPITGNAIYVGKGVRSRDKSHWTAKDHYNKRFFNYLQKLKSLNLEPRIYRIFENLSNADACKEEMTLINKFGRKGIDQNGTLYNITLGGEGASGRKLSQESIDKIAAKQRGVKRPYASKAISNGTKRAMQSPEIRKKISNALRGKPCPEITKQKLSEHFSKVRIGAGNPAAKSWKVVSPLGDTYLTSELAQFAKRHNISYVGLKSSYRSNRPIQMGSSKGWQLFSIQSAPEESQAIPCAHLPSEN